MPAEHVVAPPKVGGPVDHADGGRLLHDADHAGIAARVLADVAGLIFGQGTARFAGTDSLGHRGKHRSEPPNLFGGLLE